MKFKKIFIELTNVCGLACTFCPPTSRKSGSMSLELFESISSQLPKYTKEVAYHIVGDPLTLSNLDQYLTISHKYNLKVNITTSGFFLTHVKFATLNQKMIKQINFSLGSFAANEPKITLEEYMNRIFDFILFRNSSGNNNLFINLRLWNMDSDQSAKIYNQRVLDLINKNLHTTLCVNEIYKTRPKSIRIASKVMLHFDEYFVWPSLESTHLSHGFCYGLDSHIGILCDGRVVPCCLDKDGCVLLGDLKNQTLENILNSQKTTQIRIGFKNNICTEEFCQKCLYKERFAKI